MGFSKRRASLLLDGLFNDCKYMSLSCVINNLATIRKTGFSSITVPTRTLARIVVLIEILKPIEAD